MVTTGGLLYFENYNLSFKLLEYPPQNHTLCRHEIQVQWSQVGVKPATLVRIIFLNTKKFAIPTPTLYTCTFLVLRFF